MGYIWRMDYSGNYVARETEPIDWERQDDLFRYSKPKDSHIDWGLFTQELFNTNKYEHEKQQQRNEDSR